MRRGRKRAGAAGGHTILVIADHLIAKGVSYEDLGFDVTLTPTTEVA